MISLILAAALASSPSIGLPVPKPAIPARTLATPAATAPVLQSVAVTLECTATPQGRVSGCVVLEETHPNLGFGQAAIALMLDAEIDPVPQAVQFARTIQFMP